MVPDTFFWLFLANRLIEVASYNDEDEPTGDQTYAYDAFNQVVEVGDSVFVYDGGQAVLRFEGENLRERYLWGAAVDELLATESVASLTNAALNETLWALTDSQGTVRDVADNNGVQRKHVDYDAFGGIQNEAWYDDDGVLIEGTDPWANSQAVDQAFYYTGRLLDKATGLQNNLNRYDASIGRWLSEDPIGFGGGDANLYRYVGNQPANFIDPLGLVPPGRPEGPLPPGFADWLDGKCPRPPEGTEEWLEYYREVAERAFKKNEKLIEKRGPGWTEGPNNINRQLQRLKTINECPKPTPAPSPAPAPAPAPAPGGPWFPRFQMLLRLPWIMVTPPEYWDSDGDGIPDGKDRDTIA